MAWKVLNIKVCIPLKLYHGLIEMCHESASTHTLNAVLN